MLLNIEKVTVRGRSHITRSRNSCIAPKNSGGRGGRRARSENRSLLSAGRCRGDIVLCLADPPADAGSKLLSWAGSKEWHFSKMHFRKMHFSKMHFSKMHFSKILQIFGGLVLGCIKTKFCKKICVWQHFSSSTRFASFCTAAISTFSQKSVWKISNFRENSACKCCKIWFFCQISKISAR